MKTRGESLGRLLVELDILRRSAVRIPLRVMHKRVQERTGMAHHLKTISRNMSLSASDFAFGLATAKAAHPSALKLRQMWRR